jgi:putative transposase
MGIQSQTIGSIVRGFKAAVTTYARKNGIAFDWQQDYYDHIIRSRNELKLTEQYIRDNPKNYGKPKKGRSK